MKDKSWAKPNVNMVSVLFNEPKLLKLRIRRLSASPTRVSVLFNEPKLLKFKNKRTVADVNDGFSALQRAEIAEIGRPRAFGAVPIRVSVLFNEPKLLK